MTNMSWCHLGGVSHVSLGWVLLVRLVPMRVPSTLGEDMLETCLEGCVRTDTGGISSGVALSPSLPGLLLLLSSYPSASPLATASRVLHACDAAVTRQPGPLILFFQ